MKYLLFLSIFFLIGCSSQEDTKDYIIEHSDKIEKIGDGLYQIDSVSGIYDKIIINYSDSSYAVVNLVDSNTFLYQIHDNDYFIVTIDEDRRNGLDVSKDINLINKLK
jgi:hypothetical protein